MSNPINAIKYLFDNEIPLWFRIAIGTIGVFAWTMVFLALTGKVK